MRKTSPITLLQKITVNAHTITHVVIGRHYLEKHSRYMNDDLILNLVMALDGKQFKPDSITGDIEYFVADVELKDEERTRIYRIIWLFEGDLLEVIGVINSFRVKKKKQKEK